MRDFNSNHGFSLMELMIGVFLSTLLLSGIIQLLAGSVSAYRLQLEQSRLEESASYALDVLSSHISQAGFQPEPWDGESRLSALTGESLNGASQAGDQLGLQRWSRQNCYGNENPILDGDGLPAHYLLQVRISVKSDKNLAMTCRYGPDASLLQTQINNFGLVENVESIQVVYAEDTDGDNVADGWVTAQAWQQESNVLALKIAMLLFTRQPVAPANGESVTLLDETISVPADGYLRKIRLLTATIQGRLK
jgi:type IV pilus assembly protein PilW